MREDVKITSVNLVLFLLRDVTPGHVTVVVSDHEAKTDNVSYSCVILLLNKTQSIGRFLQTSHDISVIYCCICVTMSIAFVIDAHAIL